MTVVEVEVAVLICGGSKEVARVICHPAWVNQSYSPDGASMHPCLRHDFLAYTSLLWEPQLSQFSHFSGCRGPVNGHVSALLLKCRAMPTRWTVRFTWRTTWCWICFASRKLTPSTCWNDRSSSFRTTPPSLHSSTVCSCSCLHIFITFYILGSFILFVSRSL